MEARKSGRRRGPGRRCKLRCGIWAKVKKGRKRPNPTFQDSKRPPQPDRIRIHRNSQTIQPAPALRDLLEILHREIRRRDAHRELQLVPPPLDLHDIDPNKQDLDADPLQVSEPPLRDPTRDPGVVPEAVGAREGEAAGAVKETVKSPVAGSKGVVCGPLGSEAGGVVGSGGCS
ncbi:uncharacterized protein A4U43_C07F14030 [Asparagus officinalis]|uniref:Uncharacterized protein n=1 Tax=Asparagus officinalis TaxID=4686 RepID=A0A5P1EER9_ASPOF|nr:uncharacterized protein A4U43_C07F14030 [Asparagus officinalis]